MGLGMGKITWTNKQRRIARQDSLWFAEVFAARALDEDLSPEVREIAREVVSGAKEGFDKQEDRWLFQSKSSSRNYSPIQGLSDVAIHVASQSQQHKFCTSCGEQLSGEDKFCGSCGTEA